MKDSRILFSRLKWVSLIKPFTTLVVFGLMVFSVLWNIVAVKAQSYGDWTPPYRLSTDKAEATEAVLLTDTYGYVHVLWKEVQDSTRSTIQYARFDGSTWTIPNDIHATKPGDIIDNLISADMDQENNIHLVWVEGFENHITYSYVNSLETVNSKNWSKPRRLDIPSAGSAFLKIDSKDVFHLLYTIEFGDKSGLYYVRSTDRGQLWSAPLKLDPDIPPNKIPAEVQFQIDENDVLHAVWYYFSLDFTGADWVRYSRSVDGGDSWSVPFTIDRQDISGSSDEEKDMSEATPRMVTVGETVHLIYAIGYGGGYHRYHRYSTNSGESWSRASPAFGDLNGQAGDGFTVDGAGRVHFFSQIRFPRGIYHMIWDRGEWSIPSLVYLISVSSDDPIGSRIHAHRTYPIVRAGNQLVLTFTDPPGTSNRRLFTMTRILNDVEALPVEPTPVPIPTESSANVDEPVATSEARSLSTTLDPAQANAPTRLPSLTSSIWIGSSISIIAIMGIAIYRTISRKRH